ncbi:Serine/threonine-protein kinase RUNKEL [Nymphaea thermarum]|nr:Serine/threonine-protein kinase RUNKEL [Nymphaea thermarum]
MLVLVKMLRLSKAYGLRVHLLSLIGLLIRHSTSIEVDLASSEIIRALADSLGDKQEKVRRYAMAALACSHERKNMGVAFEIMLKKWVQK